jgi:hypothetical protein
MLPSRNNIIVPEAGYSLHSILFLALLLTGCASTSDNKRALEDYLEPPIPDSRTQESLFKLAKNFLVSLYDKREYHITYINQQNGEDVAHNKMCLEKIDSEIRTFIWPETHKDLSEDTKSIHTYIAKELGCYSVQPPFRSAGP